MQSFEMLINLLNNSRKLYSLILNLRFVKKRGEDACVNEKTNQDFRIID